jgi:hypothetical protein
LIRTNHSIEGGVALGVKLERLYRIWEELFIRYYASEADVVALFNGRLRGQRAGQPRHEIIYFRDHDDYVHALQTALRNPNVAGGVKLTTGYYDAETRRAFFAANNEDDDSTMYHEATHQLFHESRRVAPDVGFKANFWIVEGIAMYMESLRREDGYFVLGGFQYDRMAAARHRLLKDQFYVPLEEFCGYGMVKLQTDPRIATLYSQAAGLTNFLIHYDNGRYRDALVQYLFTVYTGHDDSDTLARLTGVGYGELDKQYHAFMQGQNPQADGGKSRPASTP